MLCTKMWFVKTLTRIMKYESQVVKLNTATAATFSYIQDLTQLVGSLFQY